MGKIGAVLKLTRIEHSLLLVVAVVAAEMIVGGSVPPVWALAPSIITPIFISMGAFAINDYFDIKVDRLNKKKRPLVTGEIKPMEALQITCICMLIGVIASLFINIYCFAIAIFFAAMSLLYSYRLKEKLFWGNGYIALSMVIPFVYGNYVVSSSISEAIIVISVMIFASGLAREIHGTIRDLKGDTKVRNARTVPKVIGVRSAALVALALYITAIVLSVYLTLYVTLLYHDPVFVFLIVVTDALLLYVGVGYIVRPNQKFYDKTRNISLIAMGIALIALLFAPFYAPVVG
ncbi:MAG: UbiA family prenyltransferase [Candidatus Micrarchaeota archaeon]|nr:UbiA family prenyltransferase [Candidatus Micrarchaeota archaeon]